MSKIAKAVQGFLKSMDWKWEELEPTRYRVIVPGGTAQWVWTALWKEDDSYFAGYSLSPVDVPADRRSAAAEYLMRANYTLRVGNFEMEYADGQVAFKTSMIMEGLRPTAGLIRRLAFANFRTMGQYLPGLLEVAYGNAQPQAAIEKVERPREQGSKTEAEDEGDAPQGQQGDSLTSAAGTATARRESRTIAAPRRPIISRARRISQFVRYLKLMDERAHAEGGGSCFLIISQPEDAWKRDNPDDKPRLVQFCFQEKWFAIDVPSTNIDPAEAERIVRQRRGFYREAERPGVGVTTSVNDLVQFDPIGKKYIYGDEREAAEDAAYVLYDVCGLSPDAELLVKASAFDGPTWEKNKPLE